MSVNLLIYLRLCYPQGISEKSLWLFVGFWLVHLNSILIILRLFFKVCHHIVSSLLAHWIGSIENTTPSTIIELLSGRVSSSVFHAALSQHFAQPRRGSARSIALRSSVRTPPGCRQTRVGDEVDTRSQWYFAGEST